MDIEKIGVSSLENYFANFGWIKPFFDRLGSEPPIMHLICGNLSEQESLELEEEYIARYYAITANVLPRGTNSNNLA